MHHTYEESFAPRNARNEAIHGSLKVRKQRTRDVPWGIGGNVEGFSVVCVHDPTHVLLVFLRIKGTRTIYHDATRIQTLPGISHNFPLQTPAFLYILNTPLADGSKIFTEHTLARARHIAEDEVELCLGLLEIMRIIVGDDAVRSAPLGDVL